MKKIYTFAIFIGGFTLAFSQQDEQYTQFMHYKLGFNPAYAGSEGAPSISALVRNQWIGIDGAPQTQLLTFNMPAVNNRVGIGASVSRQTIGVTENYTADAAYAYHLPFARGYLSLGLQASVRLLRVNFSELQGTQATDTDGAIPADYQSRYIPNFGAGIYFYKGNDLFFGVSVPRILESNIDLADSKDVLSREVPHFYAMGGVKIGLGEKVQLQPQILVKYVTGAPFDADVNLNLIFSERFTTGISYRIGGNKNNNIGESVSLLLAAEISENIMFGVSYDATLSELKDYNSGSVEGVIRYFFAGKSRGEKFDEPGKSRDPRFF
ncbi:MAG: type IX secretion system membrane protein PorP/SprF [Saprospiraceae bacterium]|nr:type IX secretion system membrane protein PorP/SprF [Saprospiraceae bacterium]